MSGKPSPHILISHVYSSNNNGDAAILSAQIAEMKRVFPGASIRISSIDRVAKADRFDGVELVEALMYGAVRPDRGKLAKLFFSCAMMAYTTSWAVLYRLLRVSLPLPRSWCQPMAALVQADLQVCVGGGYLRATNDLTSTVILLLLVHQIRLARLLGKPVYLYAQSFGPYPKKLQEHIARRGIRSAALVLVRETKSFAQLRTLGIDKNKIMQVPDSAFLFAAEHSRKAGLAVRPKNNMDIIVGMTVRSWLDNKRQAAYESAMAKLIRDVAGKSGYRIVVIPQVTSTVHHDDDRVAGARIADLVGPMENVEFIDQRFSHSDILSVYATLDYLVGTRFHSVIFALLSHVPAVAIEYEHKTSGIMQDLGLGRWVIPIEDVNAARIEKLFNAIVQDKAAYLRQLDKVLPGYMAKARLAANRIREDYERKTETKTG